MGRQIKGKQELATKPIPTTSEHIEKTERNRLNVMQFISKLNHYAPLMQFSVFLVTMIAGIMALTHYKTANRSAVNNELVGIENGIYSDIVGSDNNYLLSAIYIDVSDSISAKEKADIIIRNVAGDYIQLNWKNIPELYDSIMALGCNPFDKKKIDIQHRLLDALLISDRILFLAHKAYYQYKSGIITEKDWENSKSYIPDFSQSPFFLLAIYINHREKYFSADFAEVIQSFYLDPKRKIPLVDEFYPKAKEKSWVEYLKIKSQPSVIGILIVVVGLLLFLGSIFKWDFISSKIGGLVNFFRRKTIRVIFGIVCVFIMLVGIFVIWLSLK